MDTASVGTWSSPRSYYERLKEGRCLLNLWDLTCTKTFTRREAREPTLIFPSPRAQEGEASGTHTYESTNNKLKVTANARVGRWRIREAFSGLRRASLCALL